MAFNFYNTEIKQSIRKFMKNIENYCNHRYSNDEIKSALWDYVAGYTTNINQVLRCFNVPDNIELVSDKIINLKTKNVIQNIDNAFISSFSSKGNIDVYRTVDWIIMENRYGISKQNLDDMLGSIIEDSGYMSTSNKFISPWSGGKAKWLDTELILHITSNFPINYLDINKIFKSYEIDCEDQFEYLLPRNLKLQINSYICKKGLIKTRTNNNITTYILNAQIIK